MSDEDFDRFVQKLQKELIENELLEYNARIVNLFHNPKNWGKLPDEETSVSNSYTGSCGDTMQFFLSIKDNIIEKASFITDGCGASVATASQTTLLIIGKSIDFAENLTQEEVDNALNGLPADHKHCAKLAVDTLKRTIKKYKKKQGLND
jgi:nitrogen fixation NifU-like protein